MTAKYWTTTGSDIWKVKERIIVFKNLETGEEVSCACVAEVTEKGFFPVTMPEIDRLQSDETPKADTEEPKAKTSRRGSKSKSKYKGVRKQGKKFAAQCWDKKNKKIMHLGSFDDELLAAAAVQEALGNKEETKRLRNEYEEGDPSLSKRPSEE